jgi:predicted DNA-binding ribbon-helix-helix protein
MQVREQSFMLFDGTTTSVGLEPAFWAALIDIAKERDTTRTGLIRDFDRSFEGPNLTSALRLLILQHFVTKARGLEAEPSG